MTFGDNRSMGSLLSEETVDSDRDIRVTRVSWLNDGWVRLLLLSVAMVVVLASIPIVPFTGEYFRTLIVYGMIAAIAAVSLDILVGQPGLVSFGHAVWLGLGAYSSGLLAIHLTDELLLIVPIVVIGVLTIATVVGAFLTRLSGVAFAILTLAIGQIGYSAVFIPDAITGGEDGLQGIPLPKIAGALVRSSETWYFMTLMCLVVVVLVAFFIARAPLGHTWRGIQSNEERMIFLGVRTSVAKLVAYSISAVFGAIAGILSVFYTGATSPDAMHWTASGIILMGVILGGRGTIIGPVIAAISIFLAEEYLSSYTTAWQVFIGGLFVIAVIGLPQGIGGLFVKGSRLE